MEAFELFKNIEYELIRNDDDYIIYSRKIKDEEISVEVSFSTQHQGFDVYFVNTKTRQVPIIYMKLFQAIQKQLLELGWI